MKLNYFNFKPFQDQVLMTNDFGSHIFVSQRDFKRIIKKDIDINSSLGKQLLEKNMIFCDTNLEYSASQQYDLRRIKNHVNMATSLHIFVVTTACNMRCVYCQANNGLTCPSLYMSKEMAEKSVDIALQSPTQHLSFEFQGGEPLLNFDVIKHIVEYAEKHKGAHEIQYNVVSNLTLLTDEILEYFQKHGFGLSTSIDGPALVHDANRSFHNGTGTFGKVVDSINRIKASGLHIGAIQTTTKASLPYPREIVRTYADLGFESIFLRPLTPLGKAMAHWSEVGYTPDEFLSFYTKALDELLNINQTERFMREDHASILLGRMDGAFVNYMELRSPCGASVGQLAYYADGDVFTCDEGRMLHEMGDHTFRLGNVFENNYSDLVSNGVCKTVCASSILESIPTCCDCVYQPYCGTCPVVNYAKDQDVIEKGPRGYRCQIYSGMLDYLFQQLLDNNTNAIDTFKKWSN